MNLRYHCITSMTLQPKKLFVILLLSNQSSLFRLDSNLFDPDLMMKMMGLVKARLESISNLCYLQQRQRRHQQQQRQRRRDE